MNEIGFKILRRPRHRFIRQTETSECGLACIAMVADYHGLKVDMVALRQRYIASLRGTSLKGLMQVADALGLNGRALKLPLEEIVDLETPAVLHWDLNHFVVLSDVKGNSLQVYDPAKGVTWLRLSEISPHFTGIALELVPGPSFEKVDARRRLKLFDLWTLSSGFWSASQYALLLSFVLQVFALVLPYYMQTAVDVVLPSFDTNLLTVLAVSFGALTVLNAVSLALRSFMLLAAGSIVAAGVSTNIARHLLKLPTSWFARRQLGDILSRFGSVTPVKEGLTENALTVIVDGFMALVTLAIIMIYSPILGVFAGGAIITYAIVRVIGQRSQRRVAEDAIASAAEEQSHLMDSIRGITTLRLYRAEADRLEQWRSRLVTATNDAAQIQRIRIIQSTSSTLIIGLESIVSFWLAIKLVMSGGFSLGMVFAYVAYKTQFMVRSTSAIDQVASLRLLGLHLDRISDITFAAVDQSYRGQIDLGRTLKGAIELKDVSYRFSDTDPVVLERINLKIRPGEHIALAGPSGGGKSTLVKVLLGLIEPTSGQVLIDDIPIQNFGISSYHDQIAAVLQDDSLFPGSIAANIAMFDESPDIGRVVAAARVACIHNDIDAMPLRYDTWVGNMGATLSGGQQQRVILARALYREPKILVLDEGTSSLNVELEQEITVAIATMGITRIVVAHRPETNKTADRIYKLDGGTIWVQ